MRIKDFTTSFAYLLLFRNLSCSTAKFLMVTTDRNSMALNNFKVTQTIALDLLNMFRQDRDLQVFLTKLSFIMYVVRCLFIIEWFSSSGRLPVVSNLKSSFECAISSGVGQNCIFKYVTILSWYMYFVFYINILPKDFKFIWGFFY